MGCLSLLFKASVFVPVVAFAFAYYKIGFDGVMNLPYRMGQAYDAIKSLHSMEQDEIDAFIKSFEIYENTNNDFYEGQNHSDHYARIADYYGVLNRICTLGSVEKMYIPPIMDASQGVFENQLIFEEVMADELNVGKSKKVLEIGCGRGRIAHHVASYTGAHVTGMNIEDNQLSVANEYAEKTGLLGSQLHFVKGNFNFKFPFPDEHFDAFYTVQPLTYAADINAVFKEVYRVVKPGAKIAMLEGMMKPGYDGSNPKHRQLLNETRQVTGLGNLYTAEQWNAAITGAGFNISYSDDRSLGGHQYPLIEQESKVFDSWEWLIKIVVKSGLIPKAMAIMMERFQRHKESFIQMDKELMLTTSWYTVAQKPLV